MVPVLRGSYISIIMTMMMIVIIIIITSAFFGEIISSRFLIVFSAGLYKP